MTRTIAALLPLLLALSTAYASPPKSVAIVCTDEQAIYRTAIDGFKQQLSLRGIAATIREYSSASDAAAADADLIFAVGAGAVRALSEVSVKAPIIYALANESATAGLSGRVSGISTAVLSSARIALITEIAPDAHTLAIVSGPSAYAAELEKSARAAGFKTRRIEVRSAEEVGAALVLAERDIDAIIAVSDPAIWNAGSLKASVIFSLQKRKPLFGFSTMFTRGGAVASLAAEDAGDVGAQAGEQAEALLIGAPVQRLAYPRKTSISINLVVARRLGLEPGPAAIDSATTVLR